MDFIQFLLLAPSILLGLTLHEFAHGYVAYRLGDPTAKEQGRLTLNPLAHLDLMGTIMLFLVHFGWAKPVMVNPNNLTNPKRDMMYIALAGPLMNLALAWGIGLIVRFGKPWFAQHETVGPIIYQMIFLGVLINVSLAIFNLLPIPPLDGSRILHAIVPDRYENEYRLFERVGGMLLIGILILGYVTHLSIFGAVLGPPVKFFLELFTTG